MTPTISQAVVISEYLTAIGVLIASLEVFAFPNCLKDSGLQSWAVHQVRHRLFVVGARGQVFDFLFRYPNVLGLYAFRCLGATLLLLLPSEHWMRIWLDLAVASTFWLLYLRCPYGWDGADQMAVVVLLPLAFARWIGGHAPEIALAFIAAQLCISYFSAGIWKAISPIWRREPALTGILHTISYGNQTAAAYLDSRPRLSRALGWMIFLVELTIPVAVFLPAPARWMLFGVGLSFHLGCAILMGLNSFFWSFASAYPSLVYWSSRSEVFKVGG